MPQSAQEISLLARKWLFRQEWDFAARPDDRDIGLYAKALLVCAKGDGVISQQERDWVLGYFAAYCGDAETLEELAVYPAEDDVTTLVTRSAIVYETRGSLVFDALRACDADGELTADEVARIKQAAAALEISGETVERLKELYLQEKTARSERNTLLYPEGSPI
ncbi:hypothetical protein ACFWIA_33935 [Streptomyces sp. NPDC127068]|uniref:hypothetical protein n=1 Tax=Streptomyces sp. NPDC127068 TaxID=3347127 RepID=UPI00366854E5